MNQSLNLWAFFYAMMMELSIVVIVIVFLKLNFVLFRELGFIKVIDLLIKIMTCKMLKAKTNLLTPLQV